MHKPETCEILKPVKDDEALVMDKWKDGRSHRDKCVLNTAGLRKPVHSTTSHQKMAALCTRVGGFCSTLNYSIHLKFLHLSRPA